MAVLTLYRLAEECLRLLSGGNTIQAASNISIGEMKISICQVASQLVKAEHFALNEKMGEKIDNGSILGTYDGLIPTVYSNRKSKVTLPAKPIKLPRNMGIFSVYLTSDPTTEFIPLQMGQSNLIKSQPLLNDLLGQIGYENFGMDLIFTKDLTLLYPTDTVSMRLVILDFTQYGDYDPLPLPPEYEWQIKNEVVKLYGGEGVSDMLVDSSVKQQQNIPVQQQKQT